MRIEAFDFDLPEELIALRPAFPREEARLLVIRPEGAFEDARIGDLPRLLREGDVMVANDSRVVAARLFGTRPPRDEGQPAVAAEVLLHRAEGDGRYRALARPGKRLKPGDQLTFEAGLTASVVAKEEDGEILLAFDRSGAALDAALATAGVMPLPPYIASKRAADARDLTDYQTFFADRPGSVAAPTAGLHLTPQLVAAAKAQGIDFETLTLHVGLGTFLPVSAAETTEHRMHSEHALLPGALAARLNARRAAGGRIVSVGTTALRTLESAVAPDGSILPFDAQTDIFITPGHTFRTAEVLLTNFHLPKSTLFMLVSAFAGLERMQAAYATAIERAYRFFSYGDACLIFRRP